MLMIIVVALAFGTVYCSALSPHWKVTADSTTYVLGAESLAQGKGYLEGRYPAILFPPGTSLILAAAWIIGGHTYWALNAEVLLFAFGSLAICFLSFRESLGSVGSGILVLLCLGSTLFFVTTTYVLSEIFFIFFSLLALWCYRRDSTAGSVLSALAAVMVRTVGVSLAIALLLASVRKRPRSWRNIAAYAVPIFFALLWEWRNRRLGWSYSDLMTQRDPWVLTSGHISLLTLLSRLVANRGYCRVLENVLTNDLTADIAWAVIAGVALAGLFVLGFRRLSPDERWPIALYLTLYAIAIALYWPSVIIRFTLPILPLVFACIVGGVEEMARRPRLKWVYAPVLVFMGFYLVRGFQAEMAGAERERGSAFPNELAKYAENYDLQRVAVWWRDHSSRTDRFACRQPNIIGAITGRDGVHFEPTSQPDALEHDLQAKGARFLFLDLELAPDQDRDLGNRLRDSDRFRILKQERQAELFELTHWPPDR